MKLYTCMHNMHQIHSIELECVNECMYNVYVPGVKFILLIPNSWCHVTQVLTSALPKYVLSVAGIFQFLM